MRKNCKNNVLRKSLKPWL